ncbi:hypothetical protein BU17DRAFT_67908 [Hysterangium stoloniferum]|nr:hypothetical protein BU17DRAFT_67908 [Hysterangium stoloniferum]
MADSTSISALSDGQFVVIELDHTAMLKPWMDFQLQNILLERNNKQYLAVVGLKPLGAGSAHTPCDELEFHIVACGLARTIPELGVESTISTMRLRVSEVGGSLPEEGATYFSLDDLERLDALAVEDILSSVVEDVLSSAVEDVFSAAIRRTLPTRKNAEFERISKTSLSPFWDNGTGRAWQPSVFVRDNRTKLEDIPSSRSLEDSESNSIKSIDLKPPKDIAPLSFKPQWNLRRQQIIWDVPHSAFQFHPSFDFHL